MITCGARCDITGPMHFESMDAGDRVPAAAECVLGDRQVDVWAFSLTAPAHAIERWLPLLSDDERDRAARFIRAADGHAYIVAHGVMRHLLAGYCDAAPAALRFGRAEGGKPMLEGPACDQRVRFNLAHSGAGALLAVSQAGEIGVDLEAGRNDVDMSGLAGRFFCNSERDAIMRAPDEQRADAFFRCWVAKEALLKAQGTGLAYPLDAFAIGFSADGTTAGVSSSDPAVSRSDWLIRMLPLPPGWYGAVCGPRACTVRIRNFSSPHRVR